jgi:SET domain-containing protein
MSKPRRKKAIFSLSPVEFRNSGIAGRGVFARRHFAPGEVVVAYAPKQRRVDADSAEAAEAAETKLTLLSEGWSVIIPDTSVSGGWLCNHSCTPNADLYSDGEGRIKCARPISPGEEVTIFYGWVSENQPERDPCRCGSQRCLGFINFDVTTEDAEHADRDTPEGHAFRARLAVYAEHLRSIDQEQVLGTIERKLGEMKARSKRL